MDIDTSTRSVKVAIAEMETIDRDGEVFDKSAFNRTIKENGPDGTNEIWHLLDHTGNSFSALSKFKEVGIDGKYFYGVSQYKDSFAWREVAWPLYESGDFTQHSVGFTTSEKNKVKSADGSYTIITQARAWEGSAVLWGANPNTPSLEVNKSIKSLFDDENDSDTIDMIIKRIQNDKYSETNKNLLIIELLRLQSDKKFIQQEEKTIEQDDALIEAIKQFRTTLK